ncbi:MAG: sensor histidine kinase, partial [Sciscionella sp.]
PRTAPFVPQVLRRYGPFAVVPFGSPQRRLGALAVYRRKGNRPFDQPAVELLTAFAAQAALVLLLAEGATARQRVAIYRERDRIARDLHDMLIQRLYATGMQLDLLGRKLDNRLSRKDSARLSDAVEVLDETIAEVRATVRSLREAESPNTVTEDLATSVRTEVATAADLLGITPQLQIDTPSVVVPAALADDVRAALREALSNVVRHSGAHGLHVTLSGQGHQLRLRVSDDGCGIPTGVAKRGLRNIADRALAHGGHCEVSSSAHSGTTVNWQVPLPAL